MELPLVSVVVPGRNCGRTIRQCLTALLAVKDRSSVAEILFVDDGSTDDTADIVAQLPVIFIKGSGKGAGAARNIGWHAAKQPFVWFVDSDCVVEPDALDLLLPHFEDGRVAGVGGSYGNMNDERLLACLVHEEIAARHASMPNHVNFLATFNVVYRREILDALRGFDEGFLKGQDAEFSWRAIEQGHQLAFEPRSRVGHFHPVSWRAYLKTQCHQGYWRVWLHLRRRGHAGGDSYSGLVDHLQPPLAMAALMTLPLAALGSLSWLCPLFLGMLAIAQVPMTCRVIAQTRRWRYAWFAVLGFVRAFSRGAGMTFGAVAVTFGVLIGRSPRSGQSESHGADERGRSR